ncbi:MAG: PorT family protein [Tannerellaceae bacterium]|jgi:hypothetical protein|nr:PorT family protein [Tannerellaceae bacterium]
MKQQRLIILTLLISSVCLASYAQGRRVAPEIVKTTFGVKAGLNLASISNGETDINFSPGMKAGVMIGAVANLHFGSRDEGSPVGTGWFGLQPELTYSRQGFAVDGAAVNFDYIALPVMAKLYVTKELNIEAGPRFAYLLGTSPETTVIQGAQIAISDLNGGFDVGIAIGAEYETQLGLTIGARYTYGFSNMADNLMWKNSVISISAGWMFR